MRFSDLFPKASRRAVGKVIAVHWDAGEHGIRFVIQFDPSGRRLQGVCRAGSDPSSGRFVTETELRAKMPQLEGLVVYEKPGCGDPNQISAEEFRKLKIEISLADLQLGYSRPNQLRDSNSFLSRILR